MEAGECGSTHAARATFLFPMTVPAFTRTARGARAKRLVRLLLALALAFAARVLHAQAGKAGDLIEVPEAKLSDHSYSPIARAALALPGADWKHAESTHFVYHFRYLANANLVSTEAEYGYHFFAKDLGRDTAAWERKCHIFVFEKEPDWSAFRAHGAIDPWTQGMHADGELFLFRDAGTKHKGSTLMHEVAHLVVHRFFGPGLPLWLNEGYAEYAGIRAWAAFWRARRSHATMEFASVSAPLYTPIAELTAARAYPSDDLAVVGFYHESQCLVRFLTKMDKAGFNAFFEAMSRGAHFDSAFSKNFGSRYRDLAALEAVFKPWATGAQAAEGAP